MRADSSFFQNVAQRHSRTEADRLLLSSNFPLLWYKSRSYRVGIER